MSEGRGGIHIPANYPYNPKRKVSGKSPRGVNLLEAARNGKLDLVDSY